jgi:citryl-CoA synthetase large subunit
MKLKEFEAYQLLASVNIPLAQHTVISNSAIPAITTEKVFKVQTVEGKRGKAGGIQIVQNAHEAQHFLNNYHNKPFRNEIVTEILVQEKVNVEKELYLGIMFDTSKRCPVIIFSEHGGVDIEELKENKKKIIVKEIKYHKGVTDDILEELTTKNSDISPAVNQQLKDIIQKLYTCFRQHDCKMIEINPLVITEENNLIAVDASAILDDDAHFRRTIHFPERTDTRAATAREVAAHKIDKEDHRGVAGKTFIDLDGDIAILTSGGGASMTLMDALITYGGKPANFTEYSGNPPMEKVEKLARIVLSREKLSGLLIAGVIANFTNIKETLQGIANVLQEKKPNFPIVIRRAGPFDQEAKEMMLQLKQEHNLDLHYFDETTPLTKAVEIMHTLSIQYKEKKRTESHVNTH